MLTEVKCAMEVNNIISKLTSRDLHSFSIILPSRYLNYNRKSFEELLRKKSRELRAFVNKIQYGSVFNSIIIQSVVVV